MRHTAFAALLGAALIGGPAAAQTSWDMPTPYPDPNFHTQNIKQFAEDVREATGGQLVINVHPAGSLFQHPEIKDAVRRGLVPIGEVLISRLANEDPAFEADSVPFLATSYEDAERLAEAARPVLEEKLQAQGLRLLYTVPWPPQGLYTREAVNGVEDMNGLRFRAYNAATERLAQLAGAVPTQVEVPDIPTAFSTGRVEAMMTSPSTGVEASAWDFVDVYTDTQAWLPKNMVIVSEAAFSALPEDQQQAILDAAAAAEERGWAASREETEKQTRILEENGMTVAEPTEELRQGLQQIGETMTEEWLDKAGEDGERILDAYRGS
jgi:TRAP-type C4-dicarboxylate transport system substrate-binding protein